MSLAAMGEGEGGGGGIVVGNGAGVRALAPRQCGPGSILGLAYSVEFVFVYSAFPLSSETNTSKFQIHLKSISD